MGSRARVEAVGCLRAGVPPRQPRPASPRSGTGVTVRWPTPPRPWRAGSPGGVSPTGGLVPSLPCDRFQPPLQEPAGGGGRLAQPSLAAVLGPILMSARSAA